MKLVTIASSVGIILTLLLGVVLVSGNSSIQCKGDDGNILFSYDSFFNTVDIGGYPTYQPGDPWVDFYRNQR